jgi:hypothetical protein
MDISELNKMVEGFKKMNLKELNTTLTDVYKIKKKNEEQYNEIVEQLFFIISQLHKEIERKLPTEDHDDCEEEIDNQLDIRLIDVYSDEE